MSSERCRLLMISAEINKAFACESDHFTRIHLRGAITPHEKINMNCRRTRASSSVVSNPSFFC